MGVLELLLVIFIVLKLVGVITWSWWGVLAPLWIGLGFYAVLLFVFGGLAALSVRRR